MQFSVGSIPNSCIPYAVKGTLLTQQKFTRSLINMDEIETYIVFISFV